jgi:hypothetical protein
VHSRKAGVKIGTTFWLLHFFTKKNTNAPRRGQRRGLALYQVATTQKNEKQFFSEKYSPSNQLKIAITFAIRIPLRGDLAGSTQINELHRETYF